jgi:hypothetical protein
VSSGLRGQRSSRRMAWRYCRDLHWTNSWSRKARGEPPIGRGKGQQRNQMADESLSQSLWHREGPNASWGMAEFKPRSASCPQALTALQGRIHILKGAMVRHARRSSKCKKHALPLLLLASNRPVRLTLQRSCDQRFDSRPEGVGRGGLGSIFKAALHCGVC